MIKITSDEVETELLEIWPSLLYIWRWDNIYIKPTLRQVEVALKRSVVPSMDFIDLFNDCDNFALQWLAEYRRLRYFAWKQGKLPREERLPSSVGFVFGDLFRGRPVLHAANIALCEEGIYIVDSTPSENRIWKADKKNDNILFVFM